MEDSQTNPYGKDTVLLDRLYALKRMREAYEPMFYLSRKAYEGKHFVYWNKQEQRLAEIPVKKSVFNQLPETAKQVDSFENFFLSNEFTFTVVPKLLSDEEATNDAMMLSLLAADYFKRLKENPIFADYIHNALLDNVSFLEVTPNDQKNDVAIRNFDGFDILFNPLIKDWGAQRLVAKVVKRRISDLQSSSLYKLPTKYNGAGGANFLSWKDIYEAEKYGSFAQLGPDEVIIFECFLLDPVEGLTIRTIDGSGEVLRNDRYPNVKRVPIVPFRIYSGEWYQPSFAYRLIPLNRSMDLMISRMEDLMLRLAKGGWIVQGEESLNGGLDEEIGQIIRYDTNKPDQIEMPQIPNFLMQLFTTMLGMSERYGFSSLFSGNIPNGASGLRTTGMLEQITGLTRGNNSAPINNLKSAVRQVLELTFSFLYEMWDTPRDVLETDITSTASPKFVSAKFKGIYSGDAIGIPTEFKRFDVEEDDGLGFTLTQKKETALALFKILDPATQKPIISVETVRKIFKLGSSAYIMQADEKPMSESPEFKKLIEIAPTLPPDQKQAVVTVLQILAQISGQPTTPTNGTTVPAGTPVTTPSAEGGVPNAVV